MKWLLGIFIALVLALGLLGVASVAHVGAAPYQTGTAYPYWPLYWGHTYYHPWTSLPWETPYEHYVRVSGGYTPSGTIDRRYTYDPVAHVMYSPAHVVVVPQKTVINYIRPASPSVPAPATLKASTPCCSGQAGGTGASSPTTNKPVPAAVSGQSNGTGGGNAASNKAPAPAAQPAKPAAPISAPKPAAPVSGGHR